MPGYLNITDKSRTRPQHMHSVVLYRIADCH